MIDSIRDSIIQLQQWSQIQHLRSQSDHSSKLGFIRCKDIVRWQHLTQIKAGLFWLVENVFSLIKTQQAKSRTSAVTDKLMEPRFFNFLTGGDEIEIKTEQLKSGSPTKLFISSFQEWWIFFCAAAKRNKNHIATKNTNPLFLSSVQDWTAFVVGQRKMLLLRLQPLASWLKTFKCVAVPTNPRLSKNSHRS